MAKAQTIKPKSSFADWLKRMTGGEKKKPAARPGAPGQASTLTNIPAAATSTLTALATTPRVRGRAQRKRGMRPKCSSERMAGGCTRLGT